MFEKFIIDYKTNLFDQLVDTASYEDVANGRKGAVLADYKDNLIPIVRTTTIYNKPSQRMSKIHYDLIESIKKITNKNMEFNNALIEIYDSNYRTMGYHSDQSLDLAENSYICIFSCYNIAQYNDYNSYDCRTLNIKEKLSGKCSDVTLEHNSIVLFSLSTNSEHLHKIVLNTSLIQNNRWLGITFRLSKTFIRFVNEIPYFYPTNRVLKLADENEKKEFYKCRSLENKGIKYDYAEMNYTISASDLMLIIL